MGRPDGDQGLHDGNPHRPITTPCGSAEDERRADVPCSHSVRREETMFSPRRTTTSEGQDPRPQRPLTCLLLALVALSPLLVLLSGCGTPGTSKSAVTAPVAHTQSLRQMRVHLAPVPTLSTTVRVAQRHLYPFSTSNVGLMQLAVDTQGNVWVGEMHANRLGRLNAQTGAVSSWTPPGAQYGIMTTTVDAQGDAWFAEQNANYIGRFDPRQ